MDCARASAWSSRRRRLSRTAPRYASPTSRRVNVLVEIRGLTKTYRRGGETIEVLHGIDLDIPRGDFVALMGPSGSGKTTLLNLIGGLDTPTSGTISVDGRRIDRLGSGELSRWRAANVGFVFQFYNLLPVLSAQRNVELPRLLTGLSAAERRRHAEIALTLVGLRERAKHKPKELSGGQEQRVAIARAIVSDPTLLVCDEPTGDLDRATAHEILLLPQMLNDDHGKTIVMVTHDPKAAEYARRRLRLDKGTLAATNGHAPSRDTCRCSGPSSSARRRARCSRCSPCSSPSCSSGCSRPCRWRSSRAPTARTPSGCSPPRATPSSSRCRCRTRRGSSAWRVWWAWRTRTGSAPSTRTRATPSPSSWSIPPATSTCTPSSRSRRRSARRSSRRVRAPSPASGWPTATAGRSASGCRSPRRSTRSPTAASTGSSTWSASSTPRTRPSAPTPRSC